MQHRWRHDKQCSLAVLLWVSHTHTHCVNVSCVNVDNIPFLEHGLTATLRDPPAKPFVHMHLCAYLEYALCNVGLWGLSTGGNWQSFCQVLNQAGSSLIRPAVLAAHGLPDCRLFTKGLFVRVLGACWSCDQPVLPHCAPAAGVVLWLLDLDPPSACWRPACWLTCPD
jgi:hypothetical protein